MSCYYYYCYRYLDEPLYCVYMPVNNIAFLPVFLLIVLIFFSSFSHVNDI